MHGASSIDRDTHDALLARLGMEVPALDDPDAVLRFFCEQTGRHLRLARVGYGRLSEDDTTLEIDDWTDGVASMAGIHAVDPASSSMFAYRRGETRVRDDGAADTEADMFATGSGATIGVPLLRGGRLSAIFTIQDRAPRHWTAEDVALCEQLATFLQRALDHLHMIETLRESEEQFRTMADNMPAICWVSGKDGVAHWMNRAGIDFFGQIEGEAESVVHPDDMHIVGPAWERARRDEQPLEMTVRTRGADGVYRPLLSRAHPIRDANGVVVRWCGVQMDLSEEHTRKRHEDLLRALSEATRETSSATEILSLTAELLGRHLGVSRVAFAETDPQDRDRTVVERDWTDGIAPSVTGTRQMDGAERPLIDRYRRGETVVAMDVLADPLFDGDTAEFLVARGLRAGINVPLIVEGDLVAVLLVEQATPREWSTDEIKIVEDIAERTWASLSRARAERALRERERNQAAILAWTDSIRHDRKPRSILAKTMALVGREMAVTRANYAEAMHGGTSLTVVDDWVDGADSVIGQTFPLSALGTAVVAEHLAGVPFRTTDTHDDTRFDPATLALYDAVGARAFVSVPLVKDGVLIAVLSVQSDRPRHWSDAEVQFLREIAERTWAVLEHARSEERLAESEALLAGFLENAPIAMHLKDSAGRFLRLNQETASILGTSVEEAIGRTLGDFLGDDIATQIDALDAQALTSGTHSAEFEVPYRDRLSSLLSVHFPVQLADGEARVGGFTIDLTDRKRAEAALARSREALFQSEKLTALGSLLAGVSHELNNPLSIVVAQAVMLERQSAGTQVAERAVKIRKAAERCARIVQTFLAMARQKRLEREATDINAVVSAALELAEYGLRSDGITVERHLTQDLPMIAADADQLHQILVNLIINAQHAMAEPDLAARTLCLRTGRSAEPGWIAIDVIDSGPGVPEIVRRRIFEPFFTTKPQGHGTGIGLSFSQGLAEAHGGRLDLIPSTSGAHFRLSIPIDTGVRRVPEATEAAPSPIVMRRALVVDDELEIAEALADFLSLEGFDCEIANGGAEAQARLRGSDYDLIVSDVRMPGVDGAQLFAWLIAEKPDMVERIAFATGDTLGADAAQFLNEARRPVLEKPFMPAGITRLLQQMALA